MPVTYSIDQRQGLVLTTVTGSLTIDQLMAHKAALLADEQFHPGLRELSDVRAVRHLNLGAQEIERLARFDEEHKAAFGSYRLALVVPAGFVFDMARAYKQVTEVGMPHIRVFDSMLEAARWLEVEGSW